jgi:hypothetical protein
MARGLQFVKAENGVWSATLPNVAPGNYRYSFVVDGVNTFDPKGGEIQGETRAIAKVHPTGNEFFALKNVPHGAVAQRYYFSKTLNQMRRMHVWTPAGYEKSADKLPVLYLVHGGGDNDASWPGVGCAGRGIITSINMLENLGVYTDDIDYVFYDVLGDVVCGGFAMPIREGKAKEIYIVASGEMMSLYAANNINSAVNNFRDRSYAKVRGIIMNRRNVDGEEEKVKSFADKNGLQIAAYIPRSSDIIKYEDMGMTVIEGDSGLEVSKRFISLAQMLIDEDNE